MKLGFVIPLAVLLSACGGGGGTGDDGGGPSPVNPTAAPIPYGDIKAPAADAEKLAYASAEELGTLLKNGVRRDVAYLRQPQPADDRLESGGLDNAVADVTPQATPAANEFSATNVQVAGVDESDYLKYDGQYLYMQTFPSWGSTSTRGIRVLKTSPEHATAEEVAEISFAEDYSYGVESSLYLLAGEQRADALVSMETNGFVPFCGLGWDFPWSYYENIHSTKVTLFDLQDPAQPEQSWQLELEGLLHHSRKIDDILYLVTSYMPQLDLPETGVVEDGEDRATEQLLENTSVEELLPGYTVNGGERQLLHDAEDCLLPQSNESNYGYRSLHHITAINLREKKISDTACLGTPVEGLYSSQESIYLAMTNYERWPSSTTVLHKFKLNEDTLEYAATGAVTGHLGWSSPSFRMDEHEGYLRVVTTNDRLNEVDAGLREHKLFILEENSDNKSLDLIAQLPNETETGNIGKPGEDIYSVRFDGDRAYIVTFERIDPLYVLNLADPAAPKIDGELELPGFSTYLHAMGDGYLFGIGQAADSNGFIAGMKAVLFDVRNSAEPKVAGEVLLGENGWSDALHDHKALSFLPVGESGMRITFPVTMYGGESISTGEDLLYYREPSRLLMMLEANGIDGDSGELVLHGALTTKQAEQTSSNAYSRFGRGVMHGDAVYYVEEPDVWGALWSNPDQLLGPFDAEHNSDAALIGTWNLQRYSWLVNELDVSVGLIEGTEYSLSIAEGNQVNGKVDCNSFVSSYQLEQGNKILNLGDLAVTEMGCPLMGTPGYAEQESFILNTLSASLTYEINGNELVLSTADGNKLYYSKILPD